LDNKVIVANLESSRTTYFDSLDKKTK